jgi:hypothetical protein
MLYVRLVVCLLLSSYYVNHNVGYKQHPTHVHCTMLHVLQRYKGCPAVNYASLQAVIAVMLN